MVCVMPPTLRCPLRFHCAVAHIISFSIFIIIFRLLFSFSIQYCHIWCVRPIYGEGKSRVLALKTHSWNCMQHTYTIILGKIIEYFEYAQMYWKHLSPINLATTWCSGMCNINSCYHRSLFSFSSFPKYTAVLLQRMVFVFQSAFDFQQLCSTFIQIVQFMVYKGINL